jgi:4'-phosphopantetheinyl transferase
VPTADDWLGPREREAMDRYAVPRRRAEWRAGRWAARKALATLRDAGATDVEILAGSDGAPEAWSADRRMAVNVSISHRDGFAAAMAAPAGVAAGCDLELVEPREASFAADWFTVAERAAVDEARSEERDQLVTLIWSAKEAVLKVLRKGLRLDTRQVEIAVASGSFEATVNEELISGWWKRDGPLVITAAAQEKKR